MHKEHYAGLSDIYQTTYNGTKCFCCDTKSPKVKCKGSCSSSAMSISYDFNDIKQELRKLGWMKIQVQGDRICGICPKCVRSIKRKKTK